MKSISGLLAYARAQVGKPYWYGTFGQIATKSLHADRKKAYPDYYKATDFPSQYGQRVHDCVGLIKGYFWSDSPTGTPHYAKNGFGDISANQCFLLCSPRSTDMSKFPREAGTLVFMNGHVGIYAGNGKVLEARGHAYGVVETNFSERPWTKWGKLPKSIISYDLSPVEEPVSPSMLKRGDKGEAVRALQQKLLSRGYTLPKYGADGSFGAETEAAVKQFQKDSGFPISGIADEKTVQRLDDSSGKITISTGTWCIREAPNTSGKILGYAKKGETYSLKGGTSGNFIGIVYRDRQAWVSMKAV